MMNRRMLTDWLSNIASQVSFTALCLPALCLLSYPTEAGANTMLALSSWMPTAMATPFRRACKTTATLSSSWS